MNGRFAPSPTGSLHLGSLRTALVAWVLARRGGDTFVVRMEDLDRLTADPRHEVGQLDDLHRLGIDWDGPVLRQSERFDLYLDALATLATAGRTYPCFCTRREIAAAASAPHGPGSGRYPGTCRDLSGRELAERSAAGRSPAIRLRVDEDAGPVRFVDRLAGPTVGFPDDIVLRRNDGVPAYNLAVVLDDHLQGVEEVVRGDDLLHATASQVHLASLLGLSRFEFTHLPLVLGVDGHRLAKRHGDVGLSQRLEVLGSVEAVIGELVASLDGSPPVRLSAHDALAVIDESSFVAAPAVFDPGNGSGSWGFSGRS